MVELTSLQEDTRKHAVSLSLCPLPCDNILRRQPGRELSLDRDHADTLISDVQASGTVRSKHLLFKPPGLWCCDPAAPANYYCTHIVAQ